MEKNDYKSNFVSLYLVSCTHYQSVRALIRGFLEKSSDLGFAQSILYVRSYPFSCPLFAFSSCLIFLKLLPTCLLCFA